MKRWMAVSTIPPYQPDTPPRKMPSRKLSATPMKPMESETRDA